MVFSQSGIGAEKVLILYGDEIEDVNIDVRSFSLQYPAFDTRPDQNKILEILSQNTNWHQPDSGEYKKYIVNSITIKNDSLYQLPLSYSIGRPLEVDAYLFHNDQLTRLVRIKHRYPSFHLMIPPGDSKLLTVAFPKVKDSTLGFMISREIMENYVFFDSHLQGIIFGILSIMIIYNFGMWILFKKDYFLYYCLSIGGFTFIFYATGGYYVTDIVYLLLAGLVGFIFQILFCNSSLEVFKHQPTLFKFSLGLVLSAFILFFLLLEKKIIYPMYYIAPVSALYLLTCSILEVIKGSKPAVFFVVGWAIFFTSTVVTAVNSIYHLHSLLGWAIWFGFCFEVCFFSFAIGQKHRLSEQETLRENEHAFNQLKKVFYPHQILKIKQGLELEQTMPTHPGEAYVICFDIIASSKIDHPEVKKFFREVFQACHAIMMEGYDGSNLTANGYRIKEMGDGFLCSIGYPFFSKSGNPATDAVKLALEFYRAFVSSMQPFHFKQIISCSIAIAKGYIEGFYPDSGAKEYDLYGRSIVLATRYEGMRKLLLKNREPYSILILHEQVYQDLNERLSIPFKIFDFTPHSLKVRDDPDASSLYYHDLESLCTMNQSLVIENPRSIG